MDMLGNNYVDTETLLPHISLSCMHILLNTGGKKLLSMLNTLCACLCRIQTFTDFTFLSLFFQYFPYD